MSFEINNSKYNSFDGSVLSEINKRVETNSNKKDMNVLTNIVMGTETNSADKDRVLRTMHSLLTLANEKNHDAQIELNATNTIVLKKALNKRIELLKKMTFAKEVAITEPYEDRINFKYNYKVGNSAKIQDRAASFPFATFAEGYATMKLQNVTAGVAGNYYRMGKENIATWSEQINSCIIDMYNQAEAHMFLTGYTMIAESPLDIKLFNIGVGGLSKQAVDSAISKLRRVSGQPPVIYGTYTMVEQMEKWQGWDDGSGTNMFSDELMDEVRRTGFVGIYRGCLIMRINEGIDEDKVVTDLSGKKWFGTEIPEGIMYIVPTTLRSEADKVMHFAVGNLKTMQGTNVNDATIGQRFDMDFGATIIPTSLPFTAVLGDDRYPVK